MHSFGEYDQRSIRATAQCPLLGAVDRAALRCTQEDFHRGHQRLSMPPASKETRSARLWVLLSDRLECGVPLGLCPQIAGFVGLLRGPPISPERTDDAASSASASFLS